MHDAHPRSGVGEPLLGVGGPLAGSSVLVIGSGMVGTSVAYRVAQNGAAVTVVDPAAGGTASDVSFAWLNAFDKYPREYWALNASGIAEYRQLQDECGGTWLSPSGSLRWAPPGEPSAAEHLMATVRTMRRWGGVVEELSPSMAADLEPAVRVPADVGLVYRFPHDGWVDTQRMRQDLRATARRRFGTVFLTDRVVGFEVQGGPIAGVVLASGAVQVADVVIVATGSAGAEVARMAGSDLPVGGHTSTLLHTTAPPEPLRHILGGENLWVRPAPDGGLVVGCSLLPPRAADARADPGLLRAVLGLLAQVVPAAHSVRVEAVVEGTQPVPADNFPIVGFDGRVPNLYYAISRSGVCLGPRLARLIPLDLQEDQPELLPYRPGRFCSGARPTGPPGEQ
jgi:glycine/D-amino acid oxidase-like deaminating enzyme